MIADISDGICAYPAGGLGNQLFILAAAWAQAERLGCPLYIDSSGFAQPGASWAPDLACLDHPGIDITEVSPWKEVSLLGQTSGRQAAVIGDRTLYLFTESGFGYDPEVETIVPGTTLVGYYQSSRYFGAVADRLRDMIVSATLSSAETEYLEQVTESPRVSVHARRGDYLMPKYNVHHGVAEPAYFKRAMRLYDRLHPGSGYRIYSDSRDVVAEEFADVEHAELAPDQAGLRSIAALLAMASAEGILMSNSSFSWWAAWLIATGDPGATVIAPRPWFRTGESASDLLLPHWITLDAREWAGQAQTANLAERYAGELRT